MDGHLVKETMGKYAITVGESIKIEFRKIRANPPKRKLTKMELCMRKSGIGFAGMKCLNWKNMATHAGMSLYRVCRIG